MSCYCFPSNCICNGNHNSALGSQQSAAAQHQQAVSMAQAATYLGQAGVSANVAQSVVDTWFSQVRTKLVAMTEEQIISFWFLWKCDASDQIGQHIATTYFKKFPKMEERINKLESLK